MSPPPACPGGLPARFRQGAHLMLAYQGFGPDALLIAAEAFDALAGLARLDDLPVAEAEARSLADQLRSTAPRRAGRARFYPVLPGCRGAVA